ncbi:hypothetical protein [Methylobacterium sp. Leaf118]|uniref:hypothetical protein n=1 Tax=Methylobacterium sp. Leaf118 TaxID=2876562 RepID=UPI001E5F9972|nr:hypothetical protein [Methylobacterium sp. Leaf118]
MVEEQLHPVRETEKIDRIVQAIQAFDITASAGWQRLDDLSARTEVQSVEPTPEGIFETTDASGFEAVGSVYVKLNYGRSPRALSMADSYPFHAFGHFAEDGAAVIDKVEVSTDAVSG